MVFLQFCWVRVRGSTRLAMSTVWTAGLHNLASISHGDWLDKTCNTWSRDSSLNSSVNNWSIFIRRYQYIVNNSAMNQEVGACCWSITDPLQCQRHCNRRRHDRSVINRWYWQLWQLIIDTAIQTCRSDAMYINIAICQPSFCTTLQDSHIRS